MQSPFFLAEEKRQHGKKQTKKANKNKWGDVLACVHIRFLKTNAEIFKIKFYGYSAVFPIDYHEKL